MPSQNILGLTIMLNKTLPSPTVDCDFVKSEWGENEIISRAGNTRDIEEKYDNGNVNNIATYKGERLENKFNSSNVINL